MLQGARAKKRFFAAPTGGFADGDRTQRLIEGFPAGLPLVAQAAMRQGYIATAPAVRIRESTNEAGTQYILCFKGKGTLAREEIETPIDKALFQRLEAFIGKPLVTKAFRAYALPAAKRWR